MEIDETIIQNWLTKLNKWKEMSGAMGNYLLVMGERRAELANFLSDLHNVLQNLEPRQVLLQLSSVPKLLQALLSNAAIQTTESLFQLVMKCIAAVPVSLEGANSTPEIVNKSVKWVKSQFKYICTSNLSLVNSLLKISEHVGVQPKQLTQDINKELVLSLVKDITNVPSRNWNSDLREFMPTCPLQGTLLRNISNMCLSIITEPVARPLVEALLCCNIGGDVMIKSDLESGCEIHIHEALSPGFFDALNDQPKQWYLNLAKGTPLSYESRLAVWMRSDASFENEVLDLLEIVCKEKMFISRENLRTILTMRGLPKALSENISLFAVGFSLLDRIIHETKGSIHIMKFCGVVLESMNEHLRRKKLNSICHMNYAIIWSARLSEFVDALNIDWLGLPRDVFLHRTKIVANYILDTCEVQSRLDCYYMWLILQGFPTLIQKCCWVALLGTDEFVDCCLTVLFLYSGGGTKMDDRLKIKCREFVDSLRHLRSKSEVTTSDIIDTLNSITSNTKEHQYIQPLIKHLVMIFVFTNVQPCFINLENVLLKLTEDMPQFYSIDLLLQWFEETWSVKALPKMLWPYQSSYFSNTSQFVKVLRDARKHVDELGKSATLEINTVHNLRQRFEDIFKILGQETTRS